MPPMFPQSLRDFNTMVIPELQRRGLFDAEAVRRLIDANAAGQVDGSYTLLSLLCIEIWCRRFLDG